MQTSQTAFPPFTQHDLGNQLLLHASRLLHQSLFNASLRRGQLHGADDLRSWQKGVLASLARAIPMAQAQPAPPVKTLGQLEAGPVAIQRLLYETAPGVAQPALLYQRLDLSGKAPGLLFLCGHEEKGKQAPQYQAACQHLAQMGFVVLCPEVAGQGERSYLGLQPTHAHDGAGLLALGQGQQMMACLMRDQVRAVDLLCALPQVDQARLMVSGNSGGGLQSLVLALLEPRIRAAAIGTFLSSQQAIFTSGKAQDAEQVFLSSFTDSSCLDHRDLLMALAPKPLLVLAAQQDFFPLSGLMDSLADVRGAYEALDAGDGLQLFLEDTGHQYTRAMARALGRFAAGLGWAIGDSCKDPQIFEPERLWSLPPFSLATASAHACGLAKGPQPPACAVNTIRLDQGLAACQLLPQEVPSLADSFTWQGYACQRLVYSLQGFKGSALLVKKPIGQPAAACKICLFPGGSQDLPALLPSLQPDLDAGGALLVVDLPGQGAASPGLVNARPLGAQFGTLYFLGSYLLRSGQSLAGLCTMALLQLTAFVREELGLLPSIHALGMNQVYADYAAAHQPDLTIEGGPGKGIKALHSALLEPLPDHGLWAYILPGIFQPQNGKETT